MPLFTGTIDKVLTYVFQVVSNLFLDFGDVNFRTTLYIYVFERMLNILMYRITVKTCYRLL